MSALWDPGNGCRFWEWALDTTGGLGAFQCPGIKGSVSSSATLLTKFVQSTCSCPFWQNIYGLHLNLLGGTRSLASHWLASLEQFIFLDWTAKGWVLGPVIWFSWECGEWDWSAFWWSRNLSVFHGVMCCAHEWRDACCMLFLCSHCFGKLSQNTLVQTQGPSNCITMACDSLWHGSYQAGPPFSYAGSCVAPRPSSSSALALATRSSSLLVDREPAVINTINDAGAPLAQLFYGARRRMFSSWCRDHKVGPANCVVWALYGTF